MDEEGTLLEELGYEGLLAGVFKALWTKARGRQASTLHGVRVPPTIVYRFTKPVAWYFLSKDGTLKKRNKKRLQSAAIEEELQNWARGSVCGIAAIFMRPCRDNRDGISCRYIRTTELRTALQEMPSGTGILQAFVEPTPSEATARNSVYIVNWTSRTSNIDLVSNRHKMADTTVSIEERLDLSSALSLCAVTNHARKIVTEASAQIAHHIEELYRVKLGCLTLHFKKDAKNAFWCLYCSNIRVLEGRITQELSLVDAKIKQGLVLKRRWTDKRENGPAPSACCLCRKKRASGECGMVKRRAALFSLQVLDHFTDPATAHMQFEEGLLWGTAEASGAPPASVRMIHPDMTADAFMAIQDRSAWLDGQLACCFDCLSNLIHFTSSINVDSDGKIRRPFASHALPMLAKVPAAAHAMAAAAHAHSRGGGGVCLLGDAPVGAAQPPEPAMAATASISAASYGLSDVPLSDATSAAQVAAHRCDILKDRRSLRHSKVRA